MEVIATEDLPDFISVLRITGFTTGVNVNCGVTGSYRYVATDADSSRQPSAGDVFEFTYTNCRFTGGTIVYSGKKLLRLASFSGNPSGAYAGSGVATYTSYVLTTTTAPVTAIGFGGTFGVGFNVPAPNNYTVAMKVSPGSPLRVASATSATDVLLLTLIELDGSAGINPSTGVFSNISRGFFEVEAPNSPVFNGTLR